MNECLNPTAMQDDLDGAWYVINDNAPAQKDYISCNFSRNYNYIYWLHQFTYIKYGIIRCIEE